MNDPSAGSPTETLLRLLLPLNATVWFSSRKPGRVTRQAHSPRTSLKRSIGSSDGQCVQRAVTSPGTQMLWFPGSFLLSLKFKRRQIASWHCLWLELGRYLIAFEPLTFVLD